MKLSGVLARSDFLWAGSFTAVRNPTVRYNANGEARLSGATTKRSKKEHYAPQAYLESFARDSQLYVFDKTTGASFISSVRDAASQRYYYDIPALDEAVGVSQALEKSFHPFEDAGGAALNSLRQSLTSGSFVAVSRAQRMDLSVFIALQMLRTPVAREEMKQASLSLHKELFLAWVRENEPGPQLDPGSFELVMTKEEQVRTHARSLLDYEHRDRIAEILYQHRWVVLENPSGMPFITSDHPACNHGTVSHPVFSMQGLASFGAEILFPISPTHLILILERRAFPQAARLDGRLSVLGSPESVVYYNHWQVRHSYRFLYSIDDEFSLARSMIDECSELSDLRSERIGVRVSSTSS
jgi:Protein of unknown function (DUF4238)